MSALNHIFGSKEPYCDPINLGTGTGTSVLDMIKVGHAACLPRLSICFSGPEAWAVCMRPRQQSLSTNAVSCSVPQNSLAAHRRPSDERCTCVEQAFEEASGKQCKYKVAPRRGGDATAVWAATETAEKVCPTCCERCNTNGST